MDVNIHDRRGADAAGAALGIIGAVLAGIILFGLLPGIALTAVLNYFINFSVGQLWGLSLLLSLVVLFIWKSRSAGWEQALKRYVITAVAIGLLTGLSALFLKYNIVVRTAYRLFDSEGSIPAKYFTAPSELSGKLTGDYAGPSHNETYNSDGEVDLRIIRVNTVTDSVDASIIWHSGLFGSDNLRGTLASGKLDLQTRDLENAGSNGFTTHITGELKGGIATCKYYLLFTASGEKQEGRFTARNLRKAGK